MSSVILEAKSLTKEYKQTLAAEIVDFPQRKILNIARNAVQD